MAKEKGKKCMVNYCDALTFVVVCCTLVMSIICTMNTNRVRAAPASSLPLDLDQQAVGVLPYASS